MQQVNKHKAFVFLDNEVNLNLGGFCFLPSTLPQAMRLFEMESLLSIRDRFDPYPQRNLVSSKVLSF